MTDQEGIKGGERWGSGLFLKGKRVDLDRGGEERGNPVRAEHYFIAVFGTIYFLKITLLVSKDQA